MDDDQSLALAAVGDSGQPQRLDAVRVGQYLQDRFLDAQMRHHLAAELREPAQPVRDPNEPIRIDDRDIAVTYQPSRTTWAVASGWCR